jgi:hypothetical protein
MISLAYFENIQEVIIDKLLAANKSVIVAVAWMTDPEIFEVLCKKAQEGLVVELMLIQDEINNEKSTFNHKNLLEYGGKVYFKGEEKNGSIMHHKFCVIDNNIVITGSYNWSRKAQINNENIVIAEDAKELAGQFLKEFQLLINKINKVESEIQIDFNRILKRLELIKIFIALEEIENINNQIKILRTTTLPTEVTEIINLIQSENYSEAYNHISNFITKMGQVAIFDDGEVFGLRLEIKSLEVQINALENEFTDAQKLVNEFMVMHAKELGKLILELLKLKKIHSKSEDEKKEIEDDEKTYKDGYDSNKNIKIPEITKAEKNSLSKMYREASFLCHPDKFFNESNEMKNQAEELFKELSVAYNSNNVDKVKTILDNLKKGILNVTSENTNLDKSNLKLQVFNLKNKLQNVLLELNEIKKSETYSTATENKDWQLYFRNAKDNLKIQIEELKSIENNG